MINQFGVADYGLDVWFGGNLNLEQRLVMLKDCGFDGIEFLKGVDMAEAVQNVPVLSGKNMYGSQFHRTGQFLLKRIAVRPMPL